MAHDDPKRPDAESPMPDPMRELEQMIGRFTSPPAMDPGTPERTGGEEPQPSDPGETHATASPEDTPPTAEAVLEAHPDSEESLDSVAATASEETEGKVGDDREADEDPRWSVESVAETHDYDPLEAPTLSLGEILAPAPAATTAEEGTASAESDGVEPEATPPGPTLEELVARLDAAGAGTAAGLPSSTARTVERGRFERAIVFSIGGTRYAFAMGQVTEVGPVPAVTPLPRVPEWLLGVTNLRGDVLAVLDLRRFLGRPTLEGSDRHRLLVLHADGGRRSAGVVVDRVHGASSIDPETIRSPTAPVDDPVHPFLRGVTEQDERLLAILDAEKLLHASELEQFAA